MDSHGEDRFVDIRWLLRRPSLVDLCIVRVNWMVVVQKCVVTGVKPTMQFLCAVLFQGLFKWALESVPRGFNIRYCSSSEMSRFN